jgi:hypothetical protein
VPGHRQITSVEHTLRTLFTVPCQRHSIDFTTIARLRST